MKILVVTQYYYPEPFRVNEICEELVSRGHIVTVVTGRPNYPKGNVYKGYEHVFEENINGVQVLRCKNRPRLQGNKNLALNYIDFIVKANKCVKYLPNDYDIVYSYQLSPITSCYPAIRYAKTNNKKLYIYCLDLWPDSVSDILSGSLSFVFALVRKMSLSIYNSADKIGVTSKSFIEYLNNVCEVKKDNIEYIPQHASDLNDLVGLNKNNDCVDFVFMGNVGDVQDIDNVARAVKLIKTNKEFKVHIVGDGSYLKRLQAVINSLGVNDSFVFHGRKTKEELKEFYKLADACLLTLIAGSNYSYTIPGKLQEYMSAGKTIISAIDGPAREIIEEANCGLCAKASDPENLACVMQDFINNNEKYLSLGINGRKYYEDNFTIKLHVDRLEKSFRELLKK